MVPRTELRGKPNEVVDLPQYRSVRDPAPRAGSNQERNVGLGRAQSGQTDTTVELRVALVIEIDQRRVDDHRIFWPNALPSVSQTRVPP